MCGFTWLTFVKFKLLRWKCWEANQTNNESNCEKSRTWSKRKQDRLGYIVTINYWRWVYLIKSLFLATNRKKIHSSWELVFNASRSPWKDLPKHLNEIKMTKQMAITLVRENLRDWDLDKFKFGIDQWNTGLSKRSQSNGIWLFKHDRLHFWIKFFQLFTRSLWWEVVLEYFKHK